MYRWAVRMIMPVSVSDPACCLKAFSGAVNKLLVDYAELDEFVFDVEAIAIIDRAGLRIEQIPINWVDLRASRSLLRLVADAVLAVGTLVRLRRKMTGFELTSVDEH
jgi:hypothetical protein